VFVLQVLHIVPNDPVADQLQADKELFWKLFSNSVVLRERKVQRFEESTKRGTLEKLDELSRLADFNKLPWHANKINRRTRWNSRIYGVGRFKFER
jgi:hypothetical protein